MMFDKNSGASSPMVFGQIPLWQNDRNQIPPCRMGVPFYRMEMPNTPVMRQDPYTYPMNLPAALQAIQEAVAGETEDRLFYAYLIEVAPSEEDKVIIRGIQEDEIRHFGLFRQLFTELTGRTLPPPAEAPLEKPASYCDGLRRALLGEQNAVRKYRRILFAMQDRRHINILTEIITDEIRHGSLYNYLYSKNGCSA